MLQLHRKREIKLATVEKATAWIVVAVAIETEGGEIIYVSEPRIVRVIPKKTLALKGEITRGKKVLTLKGTTKPHSKPLQTSVLSPYAVDLKIRDEQSMVGIAARPPTVV
jgi:hypothetical protein